MTSGSLLLERVDALPVDPQRLVTVAEVDVVVVEILEAGQADLVADPRRAAPSTLHETDPVAGLWRNARTRSGLTTSVDSGGVRARARAIDVSKAHESWDRRESPEVSPVALQVEGRSIAGPEVTPSKSSGSTVPVSGSVVSPSMTRRISRK